MLRQKTTPVQEQNIIRINYTHPKTFVVDLITNFFKLKKEVIFTMLAYNCEYYTLYTKIVRVNRSAGITFDVKIDHCS